jgi:uncharacterized surface protein with fasciclin (FAS1) repeats
MDEPSILFEFLETAGWNDKLDTFGDEFTFVAPTKNAFTALGDVILDFLRDPENQQALLSILEYHIITGVFADELEAGVNLPTEQGGTIEVSNIIEFMFNQATVVSKNGALYKIDTVVSPDSVAEKPNVFRRKPAPKPPFRGKATQRRSK